MRTIILDNEAVQALANSEHSKHRRVVAHLQAAVDRRGRGQTVETVVPTAVRVEAGWDRTSPTAAAINRFRIRDVTLDADIANEAARIISARIVSSVADAHIGATARRAAADDVTILTSDPTDVALASGAANVRVIQL